MEALYGFDLCLPDKTIIWAMMVTEAAAVGAAPTRQNWIRHVPTLACVSTSTSAAWRDGRGFRLSLDQLQRVDVDHVFAHQSPFCGVACGQVVSLSEDKFATWLLNLQRNPKPIISCKCLWEFDKECETLSGIATSGLDDKFSTQTLVVHDGVPEVDALLEHADPDIDYTQGPQDDDVAEDSLEGVDMLARDLAAIIEEYDLVELREIQEELLPNDDDEDTIHASPPTARPQRATRRKLREPNEEDTLEYKRAAALSLAPCAKARLLQLLKISVTHQWNVKDTTREDLVLGVVRSTQGRLLQMTCHKHSGCKLLLKSDGVLDFWECEMERLKWLVAGLSVASAEEHNDISIDLRVRVNRTKT